MSSGKSRSTLPVGTSADADSSPVPAWARQLSRVLDSAVRIPGTDIKIGLDPILGLLLPELGDTLTAAVSVTMLAVAFRERVPKWVLARMLVNIAIDAVLGAIPLVGDVFDFAFRANDKNLALVERHRGDPTHRATWGDYVVVIGVGALALAFLAIPLVLGALLLRWVLASVGS